MEEINRQKNGREGRMDCQSGGNRSGLREWSVEVLGVGRKKKKNHSFQEPLGGRVAGGRRDRGTM